MPIALMLKMMAAVKAMADEAYRRADVGCAKQHQHFDEQ
jgi:hypothetical protein